MGNNCGACSSAEVQALFCELLDAETNEARAREIRAHIARCTECQERLDSEELVRTLLRSCCSSVKAPASLRRRITVEITRTEITWG